MKRLFSSVWFGLFCLVLPQWASAQIFVPDHEFAPPPDHRRIIPYHWAPIEVASTKIAAQIHDTIASTIVEQEFYNPNGQPMEGSFLFPIPRGAQLDKFTMDIDGKQVDAELLGAGKARGIYEDIVRRMKDPALLEYAGRDLLKVHIFPIPAQGRKRLTFSYSQVLKTDAGLASYVYPLNTEKFSAQPLKNVSLKIELDSKQALKAIYSPSHTVEIHRSGSHHATVEFTARDTRSEADFELYYKPEQGDFGVNLMANKIEGRDGYFLLLVSPGIETGKSKVMPKDVVFVLDTSGSMAGNKLNQAKKALQFCVENLNDEDRFEIIRFSTEVEPLYRQLKNVSAESRREAQDFIKYLRPDGSTAIDDALKQALAMRPENSERPYVVIFLTDGLPTIGETDEGRIVSHVKDHADHARIFCFGIGMDVNTHLLDKVAEETRAATEYVLPEEDIEAKVSSFFAKIKEPVLSNPTLQFPKSVHVTKLYPAPLPDLFKGGQLVLAGRYTGSGNGTIVLEGMVNGVKKQFSYDVKFPEESLDYEFVPRLWATRRVGYLMDEIRLHGENPETREEVTDLARKYGIVTPFTSYLIVEDEKRKNVPLASQSFRRLQTDSAARAKAKDQYGNFKKEKVGQNAIANAQTGNLFKNAENAQALSTPLAAAPPMPVMTGKTSYSRTPLPGQTAAKMPMSQATPQSQFAGGKTFYQNNGWVDSEVQNLNGAKPVRIQFNSKPYFEFLAANASAAPWLALGNSVQFVLGGKVYEIYP